MVYNAFIADMLSIRTATVLHHIMFWCIFNKNNRKAAAYANMHYWMFHTLDDWLTAEADRLYAEYPLNKSNIGKDTL